MTARRSTRRVLVAVVTLLALAVLGVVGLSMAAPSSSTPGRPAAEALPASPRAAFSIPEPEPLTSERTSRWATVERRVTALTRPGGKVVAQLGTRTPEETQNLVLVLGRAKRFAGELWVRVSLPVLPNNTTGWVPRDSLGGYHTVDTRLVIDRDKLRAVLYKGDRRVFGADIGVGRSQWPTPAGNFYVRAKLTSYRSDFYGPLAFGLSARSDVLTDWPAGGFVGIHGTNRPDILPGRVSHGCIRMSNEDILALGELMPIGTPVTVT